MKELIKEDLIFIHRNKAKSEAMNYLGETGQDYKIELVNELTDGNISFYDMKNNKTNKKIRW